MESSAEALTAVQHEAEVADVIRRDILNECQEINELSEAYESSLAKSLSRGNIDGSAEDTDMQRAKAIAASVKTTPRMMPMSEIMYKLRKTDFIVPSS